MTRERPLDDAKRDPDRPLRLVGSGNSPDPTPRRFNLNSQRGIRREGARIYRLAAQGKLDLADACKLGYLLSVLDKLSVNELIEERLARLEAAAVKRSGGAS